MSIPKNVSHRFILFVLSLLLLAILLPAACSKNSSQPVVLLGVCGSSDGICPSGCSFYEDNDCPKCSSTVGLTAPIRTCSPQYKCVNLLGTYTAQGITEISTPTDVPTCGTRQPVPKQLMGCTYGGRGNFTDLRHSWTDATAPPSTGASSGRPGQTHPNVPCSYLCTAPAAMRMTSRQHCQTKAAS
jgi:hypothetical protein